MPPDKGVSMPLPQSRIQHIVVLMLENRSFDHIFGFSQPAPGQSIENVSSSSTGFSNRLDPSKPASATNPEFSAATPAPFAVHDKDGPSHSFNAVNVQLCNSKTGPSTTTPVKNNGFVRSYKDSLTSGSHHPTAEQIREVMQSFGPDQLPAINQLAAEFCLCDHWFCEVPGPTMPNRMFIHAATSEGYVHNAFQRDYTSKTIYELVAEKGLTWCAYFHDFNEVLQFKNLEVSTTHFRRFDERWKSDASQGNLPNYVFILPRFVNKSATPTEPAQPANSQHAPEDVRFGEHLIADVYDSLAGNPELFKQTVLIVTYDEHGGFFDHVGPGDAPNPDGRNSPNPDDDAPFQVPAFAFDRLGLRVPTLIVSPWVPRGIVENRALQHASVIATAVELFGLAGTLNARDASANGFADLFTRLDAARDAADMPSTLNRPSIADPVLTKVAGVAIDPGDEPLDSLTDDWIRGFAALVARRTGASLVGAAAKQALPTTQGEAADFIDRHLRVMGI
jgi:phospholipase C